MPGGYGTIDTPWGAGGTTSTAGPYSASGGNQGGQGHPGGYNPNLNPPVTVDYTSPIIDTENQITSTGDPTIDARSAHLKSESEESADQYLIGIAQAMQGMENPPLTIDPVTGKAIRSGGWKRVDPSGAQLPYFSEEQGGIGAITGVGDKGALLSDFERMQLMAHQSGKGVGSMITTDSEGNPIYDSSGNVIYTGLGRAVKDDWGKIINAFAGEGDAGQRELKKIEDKYWSDRAAQDQAKTDQSAMATWPSDGGGGGGTGYYGDPRQGNPIERMANYYTPQANVIQGMVNVHQTPTGFGNPHLGGYKRGGIVSLLRLN